ncbi:MAG: NADH-quinone oxidoreductase subunit L [Anaeromyxobacter sp.]|nr:NADH-quinone oxidoreductase subunit L [Anaeromyxobacter sp.]MBL0275272.1 NADH-quinone oxidoreductase subunit L [Anaeromyxobacter sp.]
MPALANPSAAEAYLWAIILFPLAGALINGLIGKRIGKGNATLVALGAMVGSLSIAVIAFSWALAGRTLHFRGDPWIAVTGSDGRALINLTWSLLVDRLSGTLLLVITGVGTLIHVYSVSYMSHEDDAGYARFFTYLNLFVAAMLTLVLGDSLLLTFVGWEGVGLCSYLLIGFWFTDPQKAYAGRKAFIVNRVGDFGFLVGVFSLIAIFGTPGYADLQAAARVVTPDAVITAGVFAGHTYQAAVTFALLALFVGATGKSAQLPLYIWLPDAMAGPTPVSALIHAATMVTAGVYLVARNSMLFTLAPAAMATVTLVGAITALFAAVIAFTQTDIKKVLAYSTVSQLGFMFIGVGCGAWWAGVLHLVTHAFFKACLFLGAGSVMHGMGDETDIRKMGGLARKMPHTHWTFLVASIAATGILPLSGYWSKDAILGNALFSHNPAWHQVGPWAYALGSLAALGTAFYMTRLYWLTFQGAPRTPAAEHAHESSFIMTVPLMVLAVLATVALVLGLPHGFGPLSELFQSYLAPVFAPGTDRLLEVGHFRAGSHGVWPYLAAWGIALVGTLIGWSMYGGGLMKLPGQLAGALPRTYRLMVDKFRVDEIYDLFVVQPLKATAYFLWRVVDVFLIDGTVNGVAKVAGLLGSFVRLSQNGDLQRYAAIMAVAAAAILWTVLGVGGL